MHWVTYAYEVADSDVATMTFSADEEVRINSYVQLNREKQRRIQQRLLDFTPGAESVEGTAVLLSARERWEYRYLELGSARLVSPTYVLSYETTYTLVPRSGGGWIVDRVEAAPLGEVN